MYSIGRDSRRIPHFRRNKLIIFGTSIFHMLRKKARQALRLGNRTDAVPQHWKDCPTQIGIGVHLEWNTHPVDCEFRTVLRNTLLHTGAAHFSWPNVAFLTSDNVVLSRIMPGLQQFLPETQYANGWHLD